MSSPAKMYAGLRVGLMGLMVWSLNIYPRHLTNLSWLDGLIIGGVAGLFIFLLLVNKAGCADCSWNSLTSWRQPFWPPERRPFQFWLFAGECVFVGAIAASLADLWSGTTQTGYAISFLIVGAAMIAAPVFAFGWVRIKNP